MFITLEGPDGGGKTTQAQLLVDRLRADGCETVLVHEPGGTPLGTSIREMLLRRDGAAAHPVAEALLFAASRAELVAQVVRPALARGAVVVADRFGDSTLAYQGAGRGIPLPALRSLVEFATLGVRPDFTILLDLPAECGLQRRRESGGEAWTRFEDEGREFHERVRQAFLTLAREDPRRWLVLDATQPVESVAARIWDAVSQRLASTAAQDERRVSGS